MIMCRIGTERAIGYLKKVVGHPDRKVRLTLVRSLSDSASNEALILLRKCVEDKDPEIRTEAVRSIVARRGAAAFEIITDIINDDSFATLDHTDQSQILMAFSVLGGDAAVEYLLRLIKRYNLFHDSTLMFLRSAAFDAMSHNRSDRCERVLLKLTSNLRPDIRRQAVAALQHRRELIYGGDND
jgi:HEAT repeat protein